MLTIIETIANRIGHRFGFDFYLGSLHYWTEAKGRVLGFERSTKGAEMWAGGLIFAMQRV